MTTQREEYIKRAKRFSLIGNVLSWTGFLLLMSTIVLTFMYGPYFMLSSLVSIPFLIIGQKLTEENKND